MFSITVTSRPMGEYEVDGQSCWFVEQERMTKGVEENEFLDVGSEQGNLSKGTDNKTVRRKEISRLHPLFSSQ